MKKRPVKSSDRLITKKKRRRVIDPATKQLVLQIVVGVTVFGTVVLLLTGIWYGSRISALTIKTVTVEGGQTISHAQVQAAVAGTLEGGYFGLIPKRFAWTYPEGMAVSAAASINRVKNPTIERVSGTELRVVIDEYLPFALWCTDIEAIEQNHRCFFIDKDGIVFAQAPLLEGGSMYRFYMLGDKPEIGKHIKDKEVLLEITKFADALENDFNFPVDRIEIDVVGDIFFQVVGGGEIKVAAQQTAQKLLENLTLVLSTDDFKDLQPGTFSYIDLRFGNKVFVNDMLSEDLTSTENIVTEVGEGTEERDTFNTIIQEMKRTVVGNQIEENDEFESTSSSSTTTTSNFE